MILELIKNYTRLSDTDIYNIANISPLRYLRKTIPRKDGTKPDRIIFIPSSQTKMIHYSLFSFFYKFCIEDDVVFSYRPGFSTPLLKHAELHSLSKILVHLDIKDFFPSINFNLLDNALRSYGEELSKTDLDLLHKICFFKYPNGKTGLVIGAPLSPVISNIIMGLFDKEMREFCNSKDIIYSRYADDLFFSTKMKSVNKDIFFVSMFNKTRELLNKNYDNTFELNTQKSKVYGENQTKYITGLVIDRYGTIRVSKKIKDKAKKILYNGFDESEKLQLNGYLNFIRQHEPAYLNKLIMKYPNSFMKLYYKPKISRKL